MKPFYKPEKYNQLLQIANTPHWLRILFIKEGEKKGWNAALKEVEKELCFNKRMCKDGYICKHCEIIKKLMKK